MTRTLHLLSLGLLCAAIASGCRSPRESKFELGEHLPAFPSATAIEEPNVDLDPGERALAALPPRTLRDPGTIAYWPLKIDEAMQITLSHSAVMRDIDGRVVTSPHTASSVYDPAIRETDPLAGPEAALAAFDAQFTSRLFGGRNERQYNSVYLGNGTTSFRQNDFSAVAAITKTGATGTQYAISHFSLYDRNNSPANVYASTWDSALELAVRHPFCQGGGIEFNRIAGPNARPGEYRGVLIGRLNTDITLADFEFTVRNLLAEVERTYWELYFTYRDLDAKIAARDAALQTWRIVQDKVTRGLASPEREALARERYYFAVTEVENGLAGYPASLRNKTLTGTPTNGLLGGTTGGVHALERRLRFLMGLPANDGRLIRPADEPPLIDLHFDWSESLMSALWRRVELRKQKFEIKRRELEYIAAKNFTKWRVDGVGTYRVRGFSDNLLAGSGAVPDMFSGDLQEGGVGVEITGPFGQRLGSVAVRQAELNLARERAVYREQEHQIAHELDAAFSGLDRAFSLAKSNFNRRVAAHQRLESILDTFREFGEGDKHGMRLEFVFDAQARAYEADSAFYRSLTDFGLAISGIHFTRGTLLDYLNVHLTESPWSPEAYLSAMKQAKRFYPNLSNYCLDKPIPVTLGPASPATEPARESLPAPSPDRSRLELPVPPAPRLPPNGIDLGEPPTSFLGQPTLGAQRLPLSLPDGSYVVPASGGGLGEVRLSEPHPIREPSGGSPGSTPPNWKPAAKPVRVQGVVPARPAPNEPQFHRREPPAPDPAWQPKLPTAEPHIDPAPTPRVKPKAGSEPGRLQWNVRPPRMG